MKKVINGRKYDTETAEELYSWSYSYPNNLDYICETLYRRTLAGDYFLHGEGGARSKYSSQIDTNSWTGGERIVPLTLAEAQKWGEEHMDDYEKYFGEVEEENPEKSQISAWIPASDKELFDSLKESKGVTLADVFHAGLEALK